MSIINDNLARLQEVRTLEGISEEDLKALSSPVQVRYAELDYKGKKIPAWRIVYNRALGPGKGGIRFHPEVSEDEVQSLAFWMVIKNSLAAIPYGGAKGGVKFNPKEASVAELEDISRQYVRAFADVLGENKDIPAPDVYTNSQVMSWMLDEFEKIKGAHEPAMITGKPLELGGLELRGDATAQGGYIITKEAAAKILGDKIGLRVAIQGFGNAGSFIAEKLARDGFKIVAASDSTGGTYDEAGLDLVALGNIKQNKGSVSEYQLGKRISNEELLELEVDILVLAALENQITATNAKLVQAKVIIELANGPVDFAADKILAEANVAVIPDVLANSGGVIASYFEWAQNKTGQILDEEYLRTMLTKKMQLNWQRVLDKCQAGTGKLTFRQAAYALALERLISAERLRGRIK